MGTTPSVPERAHCRPRIDPGYRMRQRFLATEHAGVVRSRTVGLRRRTGTQPACPRRVRCSADPARTCRLVSSRVSTPSGRLPFPRRFDYIYCSVWHHWAESPETLTRVLNSLVERTLGRLILGLYGTNRFAVGTPKHVAEFRWMCSEVDSVRALGFGRSGQIQSDSGREQPCGVVLRERGIVQ